MATSPHPDLPTCLKALTLMTWELLSFESATFLGLGRVAFWSPLLQSGASSLLAWESCSGDSVSTFEASAGQGWHWAGVRVAQTQAWGLGRDGALVIRISPVPKFEDGTQSGSGVQVRPSQAMVEVRGGLGGRVGEELSSGVLVWVQ